MSKERQYNIEAQFEKNHATAQSRKEIRPLKKGRGGVAA
jgi:hypothetical protein